MRKISLLLVFVIVGLFAVLPVAPAYAASGVEGIDITAKDDTQTMYYLNLPLKGCKLYFTSDYGAKDFVHSLDKTFIRHESNRYKHVASMLDDRVHTFIFVYNNVKANRYPLLTSWNIEVSATSAYNVFSPDYLEFTIKDDIAINIRSEYYELFENADFTDVSATFFYEGEGFRLTSDKTSLKHNFHGATLEQREVPGDYDPIAEEGQAPDNGGVVMVPDTRSIAEDNAASWFEKFFDGSAGIVDWVLLAVLALVVLVFIGLFARVIGWAFSRRR